MKRNLAIIAISLLLTGIMLGVVATAADQQGRTYAGFGHRRHHEDGSLQLLSRYLHENLMVQALSEITAQPVGAIDQKLREGHLRAVMQEYNIDRVAFRNAMQAKTDSLIKQLADSGYITAEQEKDIAEKMEKRAQRRALMTRLVTKGLEEGTITEEEARMLMHKPR
jgi:polyhydroxyalkanoate synthesis regulator phasin